MAFERKTSTYLAMLSFIDNDIQAIWKVFGIFLDFSKAFDTENHNTILVKLDTYGIGCALSCLRVTWVLERNI